MNRKFAKTSFSRRERAASLLAHMAGDLARAERIRDLKNGRPGLTWQKIADHVGVSARAAQEWGASGGISPEHNESLATLFKVDPQWLFFGDPPEEQMNRVERLEAAVGELRETSVRVARVETKLDEVLKELAAMRQQQALEESADALEELPPDEPAAPPRHGKSRSANG